jgi:hypothetical protein
MIYNVIKATGGYRFEIFSKILLSIILGIFFIGTLVYGLFAKINDCKKFE